MTGRLSIGFIGRLSMDRSGINSYGHEVNMARGSLVMVADVQDFGRQDEDDDGIRYTVVKMKTPSIEVHPWVGCEGVADCMLTPELGVPDWPRDYSVIALGQGWDISFQIPDSVGERWKLQHILDSHNFDSHDGAASFVWHRALAGDQVCKKALEFLYVRAREEYKRVRQTGLRIRWGAPVVPPDRRG
jgi:hypothetical protein